MNLNGIVLGSPEGWIATFGDPDDNDFQLVSPYPG